jgi:hypothetical protein
MRVALDNTVFAYRKANTFMPASRQRALEHWQTFDKFLRML